MAMCNHRVDSHFAGGLIDIYPGDLQVIAKERV